MKVKLSKERQKRKADKQKRRIKRKIKRPKKNMSDAARLFRVIFKHMKKEIPTMRRDNTLTLSMLITGILRSRSGQLKKIVRGVQYDYKKESLGERFRRFVRNKNIEVETTYMPFAHRILKAVKMEPIVLMIDSTKMGGKCICLMVSVSYKTRALPFAWITFKGRKGHSSQEKQLALLKRVKELLPSDVAIILLGDGEFDGGEVVEWFKDKTDWRYVCRTSKSNKIYSHGKWVALKDLGLAKEEEAFLTDVHFTEDNDVAPVNIWIFWHEGHQCHWFFVTNFETATQAKKWYSKRFSIETLFSDLKSRGFFLNDTRLWHPERLNRLILGTTISYFFIIVLGVEAIVSRSFCLFVRTDAFYHSLFQLGLIYLDYILNQFLNFPSLIDLPPPDDYVHVLII